jgi:hypothetical protein
MMHILCSFLLRIASGQPVRFGALLPDKDKIKVAPLREATFIFDEFLNMRTVAALLF